MSLPRQSPNQNSPSRRSSFRHAIEKDEIDFGKWVRDQMSQILFFFFVVVVEAVRVFEVAYVVVLDDVEQDEDDGSRFQDKF